MELVVKKKKDVRDYNANEIMMGVWPVVYMFITSSALWRMFFLFVCYFLHRLVLDFPDLL